MGDVTQRDLAQYDDAYNEAEEPTGGSFEPWPDGKYHGATIVVAELRKTKKGDPMVSFAYTHPRASGWHWDNNVISGDAQRLGWLKKKLHLFGIQVGRLSELPGQLGQLMEATVSIEIVSKEKDGRVYVNTYALDEPGGARSQPEDDEVPF